MQKDYDFNIFKDIYNSMKHQKQIEKGTGIKKREREREERKKAFITYKKLFPQLIPKHTIFIKSLIGNYWAEK